MKNSKDAHAIAFNHVVDRVWKTPRQRPSNLLVDNLIQLRFGLEPPEHSVKFDAKLIAQTT